MRSPMQGQRDMLVLQSTIEKETEEFEAEFRLRVEELTSEKGVTLTELDRRAHAAVGGCVTVLASPSRHAPNPFLNGLFSLYNMLAGR